MSLLTEQEITEIVRDAARGSAIRRDGSTSQRIARAIETKVIEKIKVQGAVAWRFDISEDSYNQKWGLTESGGLAKSSDPRAQPLYRLPEGEGNATD